MSTYQSQDVAVRGMAHYPLGFTSSAGLFHITAGEHFYIPVNGLNKIKRHVSVNAIEVDVRHALGVLVDNNVLWVHVDDEMAFVHAIGRVISDATTLGEEL